MSLADIKNKLYKKEEDENLYQRAESEFDARSPLSGKDESGKKFSSESGDDWEDPEEIYRRRKAMIKKGAIVGGILLLLIIIIVALYKIRQSSFDQGRVVLTIQGMDEIKSGKLVAYEIAYKNNNRAELRNVTLRLNYPENFRPEENSNFKEEGPTTGTYYLGTIKGKGEGKIIFNARTYNPNKNLIYLKTELSYTPSVLSSVFITKTQYGIDATTVPIALEVLAPQVVASGDTVEYAISYKNTGNEDFEMVRIKADYPGGFSYSKSSPSISEGDNIWYIGHLSAGQEGKIVVNGKMKGQSDEVKIVTAYVGIINNGQFLSYNEARVETKVTYPSLAIAQAINGSADSINVNAGDVLNYEIQFGNTTSETLKDLIVTEKIDSPALDYSTLDLGKAGYFDAEKKIITWKATDNPRLASLGGGEGGSIKFKIRVREIIPMSSALDKNFIFSSLARIDSADINSPLKENKIISGNQIDTRLNSKLVLETRGLYASSSIANSGPIPPVVGKETTYTIYWEAMNVLNDVMDASVTAVLPTNVSMTGKISPENSNLVYNERNNTLTWNIGDIPAGTGITSEPKEVIFQIKLTPLPEQASDEAQLIGPAKFSAKDLFTGQSLETSIKEKTTYLKEDSTINMGYKVQPAN